MSGELISKKDLLQLTGISYGQLYRWKRKNLIPEDWFIKKSSFTGQETFFPKDKILERIDKIKNMKDDFSLDDIADVFSPDLAEIMLRENELAEKNIVSQMTLEIYKGCRGETEVFSFEKIVGIAVLEKFLLSGGVSVDEGRIILDTLEENYANFKERAGEMIFVRKFGVATCFMMPVPNEIYFDKTLKVVERVNLAKLIEEIKLKAIGENAN